MLVLLYDKNRLDEWYWADFFSYIQYALLKAYFKIETIICRGIMPHGNKFLKAINLKLLLLFPTKSTSLKFSLLLFLQSQNNVECSPKAPFPFHSPGTILTQDSFKDWIKTKSSWNRFLFKTSDPVRVCLLFPSLSSTDNWNVHQRINLKEQSEYKGNAREFFV